MTKSAAGSYLDSSSCKNDPQILPANLCTLSKSVAETAGSLEQLQKRRAAPASSLLHRVEQRCTLLSEALAA